MSFTYTLEYSEPGSAEQTYLLVDQRPPQDVIDSYLEAYRSSGHKRSYSPLAIHTAYYPDVYGEFKTRSMSVSELVLSALLSIVAVALSCVLIFTGWLLGILVFVANFAAMFYASSRRTQKWRNDAARKFHEWVEEHQVDNAPNGSLAPHVAWALHVEQEVHYPPMDVMVDPDRLVDLILDTHVCQRGKSCRHEPATIVSFIYQTRGGRKLVDASSKRARKAFPGVYEQMCAEYANAKRLAAAGTGYTAVLQELGEHGKNCLRQIAEDPYIQGVYDLKVQAEQNARPDYPHAAAEKEQVHRKLPEVARRVRELLDAAASCAAIESGINDDATHAGFTAVADMLE